MAEYHNRLVEFIRLYKRKVDFELLVEHAGGLERAHKEYQKKGIKEKRSVSMVAWANKYFGEIDELAEQYSQIKLLLGL